MCLSRHDAPDRLEDDPDCGEEKEPGFCQCRHAFGLRMTVMMLSVGRLVRPFDREERDDRGAEVEDAVDSFRQNAERTGGETRKQL
jgi:hypothetical protein